MKKLSVLLLIFINVFTLCGQEADNPQDSLPKFIVPFATINNITNEVYYSNAFIVDSKNGFLVVSAFSVIQEGDTLFFALFNGEWKAIEVNHEWIDSTREIAIIKVDTNSVDSFPEHCTLTNVPDVDYPVKIFGYIPMKPEGNQSTFGLLFIRGFTKFPSIIKNSVFMPVEIELGNFFYPELVGSPVLIEKNKVIGMILDSYKNKAMCVMASNIKFFLQNIQNELEN